MPRITCTVTGTSWQVTTNHLKELIAKSGSMEQLKATYVCRVARRLRKEGLTDAEIKAQADAGQIASAVKVLGPKVPKEKKVKAPKTATVKKAPKPAKPSIKEETDELDPDIAEFIGASTSAVDGDASGKAL